VFGAAAARLERLVADERLRAKLAGEDARFVASRSSRSRIGRS
jgi:hypothetical protein